MPPVIGFIKVAAVAWAAFAKAHAVLAAVIKFTVTIAASYAIGRVLSKKLPGTLTSGSPLSTSRNPLTPARVAYGQCRLGGEVAFEHMSADNQTLWRIVIWTYHPSKAVDALYLGEEEVPLDGSGNATGTYAGLVRCTHHLGAWDQTADANFIAELGSLWTSTDRLRNCTYSAIKVKYDATKFPTGLPDMTARGRWRIPYDPTDGTQDANDPATWKYTNNLKACEYDYLRGVPIKIEDGSIVRLMGLNAEDDEVNLAAAVAAINVAAEAVPRGTGFAITCSVLSGNRHINTADTSDITLGAVVAGAGIPVGSVVVAIDASGTLFTIDQDPTATNASTSLTIGDSEPRYTANGAFDLDALPSTVVDNFLSASAGKLCDIGGDLYMFAGAWEEPDTEFDETVLRAGSVAVTTPLSWREKINYVRGTFSDPDQTYNKNDFPPVISDALVEADGAELPVDLDLTGFVTSPGQAQRVSKIKMLRTRQGVIVSLPCNLRGVTALTAENIRFSFDPLGFDEKAFELLKFTLSLEKDKNNRPGFVVDLVAQETASSIYDWDTDEENTNDPAPNTSLGDPRVVAAPASLTPTVVSFRQPDSNLVPFLKLTWPAPDDFFVQSGGLMRVQYKKSADPDWIEAPPVKGDQLFTYLANLLIATNYDFRVRGENKFTAVSSWVTVTGFTMTADTTPPAAVSTLAAVVGTGKSVQLSWTKNTEADFKGLYRIYRGPSGGTRVFIGYEVGDKFTDVDVSIGTAYDWDVRGVDESGNIAAASNVVTATPTTVPSGSIDPALLASITAAAAAAAAAQSDATAALADLTDIASDSLLTPDEKPRVILDYTVLTAEQSGIDAQATAYSVTTEKTAYDNAVSALTTYLGTLTSPVAWNNLSGDTTIVGATFRSKFEDAYTTRQTLLNKIYANAKAIGDAAQATANTAVATAAAAAAAAATAQSTANTANTAANAANAELANIASDNVLTPDEKPRVILDRDVIVAEQAGIDAQATAYSITTEKTAYDNAVSALTTYLATLTSAVAWDNLSGNTTIVGTTFRTKFADVYSTRQTLLNKIASKAKDYADAAAAAAAAVPATPAAPTFVSEAVYDSTDGTVVSRITVAVAAPGGDAKMNQLRYRINGSSSWLVADEVESATNVTVNDLTPGAAYEFVVRAISFANTPSANSTTLSRSAPGKTAGPAAPSGGGLAGPASVPVPTMLQGTAVMSGAIVSWTNPADLDVFSINVKATLTNADGATGYSYCAGGSNKLESRPCSGPGLTQQLALYNATPGTAGYVRVQAVNASGIPGAWLYVGNINSVAGPSGGVAATKGVGTTSADVAAGNDSRIVDALQGANDLGDVSSVSTARTNLGLGTGGNPTFSEITVQGVRYTGYSGNRIAWDWTGGNGQFYVDDTHQGVIPQKTFNADTGLTVAGYFDMAGKKVMVAN